jgi:hypothetical protein
MNADADIERNKKRIGTDPQRETIVNCSDCPEAVLWIRIGSMRIRIQLFISMRIRIQEAKPMRIRIWILVRL